MLAHPKPMGNRFKLFFFLVNAVPAPPVPRLMHKRPVRRIHQSDYPVIHVAGQVAGQMRNFIFVAENRQPRRLRNGVRQARAGSVHINPNIAVPLCAREMPREDSFHFQLVLIRQRRNFRATPAARIEFPTVIAALDGPSVKPPIGKRNPAMGTRIAHRKRRSVRSPAQHQRHFQQHRRNQLLPGNLRAPQCRIPEVPQESQLRSAPSVPRRLRICSKNRFDRIAHQTPSRAQKTRPGSIVVYRPIPEQLANSPHLRECKFDAILEYAQRLCTLLSISDPSRRSGPRAVPIIPQIQWSISSFVFSNSLSRKGLPWLHSHSRKNSTSSEPAMTN